jgi:hypothetical protein
VLALVPLAQLVHPPTAFATGSGWGGLIGCNGSPQQVNMSRGGFTTTT